MHYGIEEEVERILAEGPSTVKEMSADSKFSVRSLKAATERLRHKGKVEVAGKQHNPKGRARTIYAMVEPEKQPTPPGLFTLDVTNPESWEAWLDKAPTLDDRLARQRLWNAYKDQKRAPAPSTSPYPPTHGAEGTFDAYPDNSAPKKYVRVSADEAEKLAAWLRLLGKKIPALGANAIYWARIVEPKGER